MGRLPPLCAVHVHACSELYFNKVVSEWGRMGHFVCLLSSRLLFVLLSSVLAIPILVCILRILDNDYALCGDLPVCRSL